MGARFQRFGRETQRAILAFLFEIAHAQKLTRQVHPLLLSQLTADAIRGQFVMSPTQNLLVLRAEQNVRDVTRAKLLARVFDARKELLRGDGDIRQRGGGRVAVVAVGAIVGGVGFAEVVEQRLSAAGCLIFGVTDDGVQVLDGDAPFLAFLLVNEVIEFGNVGVTV